MKYIYISDKTKEKMKLANSPSADILQSYGNIKKSNNTNWGIFLLDKDELVGVCEVMYEVEEGIPILLIVFMFIDEQYRSKKLCSPLLKRTILQNNKMGANKVLIKVVIAGGVSVLKCLIRVFNELKYKIHKYKSDKKEDIKQLKFITSEEAIKIVTKNIKKDIWQTLFFSLHK
jgi:hypothetical protein